MFGTVGGPELLLILMIALIVFGPSKLPEIGASIGKMLREFQKASSDFKRTIEEEVEADRARIASEAHPIKAPDHEVPSPMAELAPAPVELAPAPAEPLPTVSRESPVPEPTAHETKT